MDNYEFFRRLSACRDQINAARGISDLTTEEKRTLDDYEMVVAEYERKMNEILTAPEAERNARISDLERQCTNIIKDTRRMMRTHNNSASAAQTTADSSLTNYTGTPSNSSVGPYVGGNIGNAAPVNRSTSDDEEEEENKKLNIKRILQIIGVAGLCTLIGFGLGRCSKKNKERNMPSVPSTTYSNTTRGIVTTTEALTELTTSAPANIDIDDIDLTNDKALENYAKFIKDKYDLDDYSLEDVIDAIRIANIDLYEGQGLFDDIEHINESTLTAGKLGVEIGSDNLVQKDSNADYYIKDTTVVEILQKQKGLLSISDFASAQTENGYDLYKVCEICIKKYKEKGSNYVGYARALNEFVAQFGLNFSIASESPVSTYYVIMGEYNTICRELSEDPTLKFGTVYGTGNNDGRGGDICVEELAKYMTAGNPDNIFFNGNEIIAKKYIATGRTRS